MTLCLSHPRHKESSFEIVARHAAIPLSNRMDQGCSSYQGMLRHWLYDRRKRGQRVFAGHLNCLSKGKTVDVLVLLYALKAVGTVERSMGLRPVYVSPKLYAAVRQFYGVGTKGVNTKHIICKLHRHIRHCSLDLSVNCMSVFVAVVLRLWRTAGDAASRSVQIRSTSNRSPWRSRTAG